ncbi:MAG: SBBP repeat-containing protein, partial [Candidatus Methylomirabilales bacterium]
MLKEYGSRPLSFEVNQGQTDAQVKFLARGRGYTLFLTPTEVVLVLTKPGVKVKAQAQANPVGPYQADQMRSTGLRIQLVGANPNPDITGLEELPGKSHYFIGNDPSKWRTAIPHYAKVRYHNVYPGVDLVFYGKQQLEYDFVVAPGADPGAIRLGLEGADTLAFDAQGDLVLHIDDGEVVLRAPVIYQEMDGIKRAIPGRYVLKGKHRVSFQLAAYDTSKPLIIDPVLSYSTFLGGSGSGVGGRGSDSGRAIAVDPDGNAYVTGLTTSTNFPTKNAFQPGFGSFLPVFSDAFVTKLDAAGALVYSTFLGGARTDIGLGIAVDTEGNAYVTGETRSGNFPTVSAFQPFFRGGPGLSPNDAFVAKV